MEDKKPDEQAPWSPEQLGSAEIERKFLVDMGRLPELEIVGQQQIRQGYLSPADSSHELRLRSVGDTFSATLKGPGSLNRRELHADISASAFYGLWNRTSTARIEKVRLALDGGMVVDFFESNLQGLVIAEMEFASEKEAAEFTPPDWVYKEVTGLPEFLNRNLVKYTAGDHVVWPQSLEIVSSMIRDYRRSPRPVVVGIAGPSASGKTTFARALHEVCGQQTPLISIDDYNRGKRSLERLNGGRPWLNWDSPVVYDTSRVADDVRKLKHSGEPITKPIFNFPKAEALEAEVIPPSNIIIIEGLYALDGNLRGLVDVPIYVDAPVTTRLMRRLERDSQRTNWSEQEIFHYFMEQAEPESVRYVEPQQDHARLVVNT